MVGIRKARPGLAAGGRAATMVAAVASSRRDNRITIYAQGKPVGHVDIETGIFHKTCRASRHLMRRPAGWALDTASLDQAERAAATVVRITDIETGRVYTASIKAIRDNGVLLDRGCGEQLLLPLDKWTVRDSRQLDLWGAA